MEEAGLERKGQCTKANPAPRSFSGSRFPATTKKLTGLGAMTINEASEASEGKEEQSQANVPRGIGQPEPCETHRRYHLTSLSSDQAEITSTIMSLDVNTEKEEGELLEDTMEDLKVPLIDTPVVALHSSAVLPKDGENAMKYAMDRKNEAALKKAHEARPAVALSNFMRATMIWADNLLQNPEIPPLVLLKVRSLLKVK
ncbi:UNVERIFIED_CONTAM: hypothetical protein K2H54_040318 [Gekko kuhli]